MKQEFTPQTDEHPAPPPYAETTGSMKQLFVLLWILWANMLWIFGIPSLYFIRKGYWQAFVSVPVFLFMLYAGWQLFRRSRREWQKSE